VPRNSRTPTRHPSGPAQLIPGGDPCTVDVRSFDMPSPGHNRRCEWSVPTSRILNLGKWTEEASAKGYPEARYRWADFKWSLCVARPFGTFVGLRAQLFHPQLLPKNHPLSVTRDGSSTPDVWTSGPFQWFEALAYPYLWK
jgi:hypothetical protein